MNGNDYNIDIQTYRLLSKKLAYSVFAFKLDTQINQTNTSCRQ